MFSSMPALRADQTLIGRFLIWDRNKRVDISFPWKRLRLIYYDSGISGLSKSGQLIVYQEVSFNPLLDSAATDRSMNDHNIL